VHSGDELCLRVFFPSFFSPPFFPFFLFVTTVDCFPPSSLYGNKAYKTEIRFGVWGGWWGGGGGRRFLPPFCFPLNFLTFLVEQSPGLFFSFSPPLCGFYTPTGKESTFSLDDAGRTYFYHNRSPLFLMSKCGPNFFLMPHPLVSGALRIFPRFCDPCFFFLLVRLCQIETPQFLFFFLMDAVHSFKWRSKALCDNLSFVFLFPTLRNFFFCLLSQAIAEISRLVTFPHPPPPLYGQGLSPLCFRDEACARGTPHSPPLSFLSRSLFFPCTFWSVVFRLFFFLFPSN